jgi:hypothetical protein
VRREEVSDSCSARLWERSDSLVVGMWEEVVVAKGSSSGSLGAVRLFRRVEVGSGGVL